MPKISTRAAQMQASPLRKLAAVAEERKKKGVKVYHLNIGQPDLPTDPIFNSTINKAKQKTISYALSNGLPETLEAWQKYFKDCRINFKPEEMIVTTGGSEAIIFAMCAVADSQDEILVFEPFYTNYNGFATLADVKLKPVTLSIEDNFHLPSDEKIIKAITKKTKAILVNNPSNPTGTIFSRAELKRLVKIAKKHNLFILSDEVYREYSYERKAVSLASFSEVKNQVIILESVSKRFNLCGARIGVLASHNEKIVQTALKFAMARLAVASSEQLAVVPMLKNYKKYTKELVKEFDKRRQIIYKGLKEIPGLTFSKPEGAFYIVIGLPVRNAEHFTKWLIEKFQDKGETVLLAPAADFYATKGKGKNEVRLAFMLKEKDLKRSLDILKKALEKYNK